MREFERRALELLLGEQRALLDLCGSKPTVDATGGGYFATWRHEHLPTRRQVLDDSMVLGRRLPGREDGSEDDVEVGFLAFVGQQELALECYSLIESPVDEAQRDQGFEVGSREAKT